MALIWCAKEANGMGCKNGNQMGWLKILIPTILLFIGFLIMIVPKFTGEPLVPVYNYDDPSTKDYNELKDFPFWQIPFVYIFSYFTRAWGALLFAFMLGGFVSTFISKERMMKYFSSKNPKNYFLAALLAPVFTVCSCAMIPIFGGIMMAGAGIGPAITFLLMAPAANVMAIIFTADLISWKIALFRLLFSFFGAIIIGAILSKTKWGLAVERKYGTFASQRNEDVQKMDFKDKCWESGKVAWDLTKKVTPYLLGGIFFVAFIEAYLPTDIIADYMNGVLGVFIAGVMGVPTYTPTLVEVFFVKALIKAGMSPSSALAFLIGAPMASIPSMLGVSKIVGWKVVINYAILAIIVAIIAGLCYLWLGLGL